MVKSNIKSSSSSNPILMNCLTQNRYMYAGKIVMMIIAIIIIVSLNNLEHSNCKCYDLPHRKYLKEWFIFLIVFYLIMLTLFSVSNEACWIHFQNYPLIYGLMLIVSIINIVMLIRTFLYIRLLRETCECGYGNKEKFLYWYLIIIFSLWVFMFLLALFIVFMSILKFNKN